MGKLFNSIFDFFMEEFMSTIVAIATAMGVGSIGIIRMSGKECFNILKKIFVPKNKDIEIENIPGYTIKYGYIINPENNEKIDEVLVSFFRAPKSYTTEDMCEINSHGGTVVEQKILEQCLLNGASLAEPGEFTKRAFLNGRLDLSQAESVMDIINAKTDKEAKASLSQLEGSLSKDINMIRKELLDIMADIEASIDYPEYDIEETTNQKVMTVLENIKRKLMKLESSFDDGKILKDGVKTVIVGKPNAGKSSLLNIMLNEDRAIVSECAGTTRDTIEEFIRIQDVPLKIIDTAGIRDTDNKVEAIGVKKAINLIEDADLIIAVFDYSEKLDEEDFRILDLVKNKKTIILLNKSDLRQKNDEMINYMSKTDKTVIRASMRTKNGIDELYSTIVKMFKINDIDIGKDTIITNVRHKNQIHKSIQSIDRAMDIVNKQMPIDIIAVEIKQTLENLGSITGDNVSEDIINEIFSKFCLGK